MKSPHYKKSLGIEGCSSFAVFFLLPKRRILCVTRGSSLGFAYSHLQPVACSIFWHARIIGKSGKLSFAEIMVLNSLMVNPFRKFIKMKSKWDLFSVCFYFPGTFLGKFESFGMCVFFFFFSLSFFVALLKKACDKVAIFGISTQ